MAQTKHTMKEFIDAFTEKGILEETQGVNADTLVAGITFDSEEATEGSLFFCKGAHFKEEYLVAALEKGAVGYVSEAPYGGAKDAAFIQVSDIRLAMGLAADLYYDHPWESLHIAAVTGTKGKSSTAYFLKSMIDAYLSEQDKKDSGILSSIENYNGVTTEESHLTTAEAFVLQKEMQAMVANDVEYLTMEVSSQALKYHRVYGIPFEAGAMLNIGEDHISDVEHDSVEDYVASKLKLFEQTKVAAISLNNPHFKEALDAASSSPMVERIIIFGIKGEVRFQTAGVLLQKPVEYMVGYDVESEFAGTSFTVDCAGFGGRFFLPMPGIFNVENALAALALGYALGIPPKNMQEGLAKAKVSGRMEVFTNEAKDRIVIADYAHNKLSFETLFNAVKRDYPDKKIVIVFGSVGGKAYNRREELGTIAGQNADYIIITEDEPGEEDVYAICNEIARHVEAAGGTYEIEPDRMAAVQKAILEHGEDAVVLVTGKGREETMKRGNYYEPILSDVRVICETLGIEDPRAAEKA